MLSGYFDSEDVIATSGVPQPPQDQRNVSMNSPNYEKGNGGSVNGWMNMSPQTEHLGRSE